MTNFAQRAAHLGFTVTVMVLAGTLAAQALDNGSGGSGTSSCEQTAKGDFNANVNSCNNVLSDLPDQLAQCIADAKGDLDRALSACRSGSAAMGGLGNTTVQGGNGVNGGNGGKGTKLNGIKLNAPNLAVFG